MTQALPIEYWAKVAGHGGDADPTLHSSQCRVFSEFLDGIRDSQISPFMKIGFLLEMADISSSIKHAQQILPDAPKPVVQQPAPPSLSGASTMNKIHNPGDPKSFSDLTGGTLEKRHEPGMPQTISQGMIPLGDKKPLKIDGDPITIKQPPATGLPAANPPVIPKLPRADVGNPNQQLGAETATEAPGDGKGFFQKTVDGIWNAGRDFLKSQADAHPEAAKWVYDNMPEGDMKMKLRLEGAMKQNPGMMGIAKSLFNGDEAALGNFVKAMEGKNYLDAGAQALGAIGNHPMVQKWAPYVIPGLAIAGGTKLLGGDWTTALGLGAAGAFGAGKVDEAGGVGKLLEKWTSAAKAPAAGNPGQPPEAAPAANPAGAAPATPTAQQTQQTTAQNSQRILNGAMRGPNTAIV